VPDSYRRQLEALVALTRAVSSGHEEGALLRELMETASRTVEVERASIWLLTEDGGAIVCRDLFERSCGRHLHGQRIEGSLYPGYFEALRATDVIAAHDAAEDPRTREFASTYLAPLGITSMLDAPLVVMGELAGVLCLEHVGPARQWSYPEQGFAVSVANLAGLLLAHGARARSEERFRELAEHIDEVFYNYDPVHERLLYVNEAFERMWGRPLEAASRGPLALLDAVHPEDRAEAEGALERQLAGAETSTDFRVVRPDGGIRWLSERAVPILDADGRVTRVVGTVRDVTEVKRHERVQAWESRVLEAISSGAALARVLDLVVVGAEEFLEGAVASIMLVDPQGKRLVHGSAPNLPESYSVAVDGAPIGPAVGSCGTAAHRGEAVIVTDIETDPLWAEYRGVAAAHGLRACWSAPVRDATGEVRATFGVYYREPRAPQPYELQLIERTARVVAIALDRDRHERELRASEERFRSIVQNAATGIAVVDLDGRFTESNAAFRRTLDYSEGELRYLDLGSVTHLEDRARVGDLLRDLFVGARESFVSEARLRARGGDTVWARMSGAAQRDPTGHCVRAVLVAEDVTDRKRLERHVLRAQRLESVGTLAGGIAHDINNALAPILTSIGLLRLELAAPRRHEILDTIEASARRGAQMVRRIMAFAGGEEGERGPLHLASVVEDVARVVRDTFPRRLELAVHLPAEAWVLHADPTQLHQLIRSLCVNARDAMPRGGRLTLTVDNVHLDALSSGLIQASQAGPHVKLTVEDTGTGIPPELQDRVFDPFFTTREVGEGAGLGLSTAASIARSHGGFLTLDSAPGRGTRVEVYLPAELPTDLGEVAVAESQEGPPRGRGELILVVEDEDAVRAVVVQTLARFGYRTLEAANGADAVALFAQRRDEVDLVLTDMAMPILDGPSTIRILRSLQPGLTIVASSGRGASEHRLELAAQGVVHFVSKPCTLRTLLSTLRRALDDAAARG